MTEYLKFVKQMLIVGSIDLLKLLEVLLILPVITKMLGAEQYGIWTQLKITMSLLVPFTFLGLHESLGRFLPGAKEDEVKEGVYSSSAIVFLVTVILSLLLIVFAQPASRFFGFEVFYVNFLALLIIFESLNTIFFVVIRALRDISKYFWFMALRMVAEIILVILAVFLGYGLYGAVISFLAVRILMFGILVFYTLKKVGKKVPQFSVMRDYLKFGLPTMADHISYWVITSVDRYFIGFLMGIVFVGYYAPAYSIGTLLNLFLFPIAFMLSIVLPKLFDENNMAEVKKYLSHSLKYFLLFMIPSVFGLSLLSKELLLIFSTKEISDNAYLVVPFITTSIFLYGLTYFFSQILILKKNTKTIALVWASAALLNFSLNVIFIPKFGILGAAITTLLAYLCGFLLMRYFALKELVFHVDMKFALKSLFSALMMALLILLFNPQGLVKVMAFVLMGALLYGILMFLTKAIDRKEIVFFKNLLLTFNKKA
ncbi:MAG: flippase [Patescibacteria group bacterium]